MRVSTVLGLSALIVGSGLWANRAAAVTAAEAEALARDLTPVGAERAGNAAGTIPTVFGMASLSRASASLSAVCMDSAMPSSLYAMRRWFARRRPES